MTVKGKKNVALVNTEKVTEDNVECKTKSGDIKIKPELICYYNNSKPGVDSIDQLCSYFDIASRKNRWSIAVFCWLLEVSLINAYTLLDMEGSHSTDQSRRRFSQAIALKFVLPFIISRNKSRFPVALQAKINCVMATTPEDILKDLNPVVESHIEQPELPVAPKSGRCSHVMHLHLIRRRKGISRK